MALAAGPSSCLGSTQSRRVGWLVGNHEPTRIVGVTVGSRAFVAVPTVVGAVHPAPTETDGRIVLGGCVVVPLVVGSLVESVCCCSSMVGPTVDAPALGKKSLGRSVGAIVKRKNGAGVNETVGWEVGSIVLALVSGVGVGASVTTVVQSGRGTPSQSS